MVFLLKTTNPSHIEKKLIACNYHKTGDRTFIRLKNPPKDYPFYKVKLSKDAMNHNILVTITMETLPEVRYIKGKDMVIYHKGTFVEEELARLVHIMQ